MLNDLKKLLKARFRPEAPPACPPASEPIARHRAGAGPLVSIVTIVLNRRQSMPRTIDSVRAQTYGNFEYIVLDGGSTDGTIELIEQSLDCVDDWRSARDGGLYRALNEGVKRSRGKYVQFVHSDDWLEPDQIARAVEVAERTGADLVHGDLMMHLLSGETIRLVGSDEWHRLKPRIYPAILHPTVLARRDLYERIGLFRTDLRIASDFDWLLRVAQSEARTVHDPAIVAHMSEGGVSSRRQRLALAECIVVTRTLPGIPREITRGFYYLLATNGRPGAIARRARHWLQARRAQVSRVLARARSGPAWFRARLRARLCALILGTPLERPARAFRERYRRLRYGSPAPKPIAAESSLRLFAAARDAGDALSDAAVMHIVEHSRSFRAVSVRGEAEGRTHAEAALHAVGCAVVDVGAELSLRVERGAGGSFEVVEEGLQAQRA